MLPSLHVHIGYEGMVAVANVAPATLVILQEVAGVIEAESDVDADVVDTGVGVKLHALADEVV